MIYSTFKSTSAYRYIPPREIAVCFETSSFKGPSDYDKDMVTRSGLDHATSLCPLLATLLGRRDRLLASAGLAVGYDETNKCSEDEEDDGQEVGCQKRSERGKK